MSEDTETRLKRLRMRAWRRGMKETDLLLGQFADRALSELNASDLDSFERLLAKNDQDILAWATGASEPPREFEALITQILENR